MLNENYSEYSLTIKLKSTIELKSIKIGFDI